MQKFPKRSSNCIDLRGFATRFWRICIPSTHILKLVSPRMHSSGLETIVLSIGHYKRYHYSVMRAHFFCPKDNLFPYRSILTHQFRNREQINAPFKRSVIRIYFHNVSFRTKSRMLYNFVTHFPPPYIMYRFQKRNANSAVFHQVALYAVSSSSALTFYYT